MRRITVLLLVAVMAGSGIGSAQAAVPDKINAQGRLTDAAGQPLPAGNKTLAFSIHDAEVGGNQVWPAAATEDQVVTTGNDGLWTAFLGTIHPLTDDFFADTARWLEVTVDDGINPPETLPRIRLVTGPYAHRVATVDGASGGNITSSVSIGPGHTISGSKSFAVGEGHHLATDWVSIAGGKDNSATVHLTFIGGGSENTASATWGTICGGHKNSALGTATFVGGGNANHALGPNSAVVAGISNSAGITHIPINEAAFVGAGMGNTASGLNSGIVSGCGNVASGSNSFIGGGLNNVASADASTVPGGQDCEAGDNYTFAAGLKAKSYHRGSFIWADYNFVDFQSVVQNEFAIRVAGGVRFVLAIDSAGNPTNTVSISDGSSWAYTSDRNLKDNIRPVDGGMLLSKLAAIPISHWNAKGQEQPIEHIGPMAQDFYAAFGLGTSERQITSSDVDGVALAAIQELARQNAELKAELTELRRMIHELVEQH